MNKSIEKKNEDHNFFFLLEEQKKQVNLGATQDPAFPANDKASLTSCGQSQHGNGSANPLKTWVHCSGDHSTPQGLSVPLREV